MARNDTLMVTFDVSNGRDAAIMAVSRIDKVGNIRPLNTYFGSEATDLYRKLAVTKEKKP